jgi:hypothetical protein
MMLLTSGSICLYIVSSLHLQSHPTKDIARNHESHPTKDIVRKYGPLDSIQCLELSLKKVVLMNYDGSKRPSVDFARFFILNTKMLKEMEIQVLNNGNDEWMTNQHKQLCVENRASLDARIELKIEDKKTFMRVDTHDLSRADPFAFMSPNQYFKMG